MTEAPPPYSSLNFPEFYSFFATNWKDGSSNNFTDEQKMKFMDGMNQVMTDDSKLKKLEAEMDQLGKASATIRQVFSDVASSFQAVYDNSNHDEFKSGLKKLQTKWDGYKLAFNDIEIKAKRLATEAHVVANDFSTDFADYLCDPDEPIITKKKEIEKYKTHLKADEQKSTQIKADLDTLVANLGTFNTDWQDLAKKENTSIDSKAKALDDKITSLNTQIDQVKSKITLDIIALGITLGGVAACFIAGFFFPAFWFGIVIAGGLAAVSAIMLSGHLKDRENLEGQRDSTQKELDQLKAQQARIKALLTGINSVENETKKAIDALRVFQNVWQGLISDLSDVAAELDLISDDQSSKLAHSRIRTTANMYKTAATAMKYYASKA